VKADVEYTALLGVEVDLEAGDAFYVPEGHNPLVEAGTEYVQFSPSGELHVVSAVTTKNAQPLGMG
jgi:hypothetical protein